MITLYAYIKCCRTFVRFCFQRNVIFHMDIWIRLQVILATNIAESSVTIPGVAYIIDSCRSLQVFWDPIRKVDSCELVWVSKSQVH